MSRWITIAATVCNVLLVGVTAGLIYKDLRRRSLQTSELSERELQLEREVEERTRELVALSTHLQSVTEREKASLARELHDELGGLLVGARMDISWAEQHLAAADNDMKLRLNRVQQNLSAGIDLKRRIIEQLRPTLLDNVGFIAALRWQFKETCARAGLKCTEYFPDEEPKLTSDASIALFRIAQEAFANITKHSDAKAVDVSLDIDDDNVVFAITDDGKGISDASSSRGAQGLASMRHRVRALGGMFNLTSSSTGGTALLVRIPVSNALRPLTESEPLST
jgi:signal transduction histidine kinase